MKIQLSIVGGKAAIKRYDIPFENKKVSLDMTWNMLKNTWNDLYGAINGTPDCKVIFHNRANLKNSLAGLIADGFHVDNALAMIDGMIELACLGMNSVVVTNALEDAYFHNEIKIGYRMLPNQMGNKGIAFDAYDIAPFGCHVFPIYTVTPNDPKHFNGYMEKSNALTWDTDRSSRFMITFKKQIKNIAKVLTSGMMAPNAPQFSMVPLPYITKYYMNGILKEAQIKNPSEQLKRDLASYASVLMLNYALMYVEYDLDLQKIDEDDYWTSLSAFIECDDETRASLLQEYWELFNFLPYLKKRGLITSAKITFDLSDGHICDISNTIPELTTLFNEEDG